MNDGHSMSLRQFLGLSAVLLAVSVVAILLAKPLISRQGATAGSVSGAEVISAHRSPDFGAVVNATLPDVIVGDVSETTILIPNRGTGISRLAGIELGCSCLSARLVPEALEENGTGSLTVRLNRTETVGPIRQRVALTFRDSTGADWTTLVMLAGEIRSWCQLNPRTIDLGEVRPGAVIVTQLAISATADVGTVEFRSTDASVSFQPTTLNDLVPGRESSIEVAVRVPSAGGRQLCHERMELVPESGRYGRLQVPILYSVAPPVSVRPPRIVLTSVELGGSIEKDLRIRSDVAVSPTGASLVHELGPALQHEFTRDAATDELVLRVVFSPDASRQLWSDDLRLKMGDSTVTIPFVARIRQPVDSARLD